MKDTRAISIAILLSVLIAFTAIYTRALVDNHLENVKYVNQLIK